MVPAYRRLHPMMQVYMVMEPAMVCLMLAGAIRGFVEALVLVGVSVEAEAGATAEAGLVIGGKFELAINT